MRESFRAYADDPEVLEQAMESGWTKNVGIHECCQTPEERLWYVQAVRQQNWTKAELMEQIHDGAYPSGGRADRTTSKRLLASSVEFARFLQLILVGYRDSFSHQKRVLLRSADPKKKEEVCPVRTAFLCDGKDGRQNEQHKI